MCLNCGHFHCISSTPGTLTALLRSEVLKRQRIPDCSSSLNPKPRTPTSFFILPIPNDNKFDVPNWIKVRVREQSVGGICPPVQLSSRTLFSILGCSNCGTVSPTVFQGIQVSCILYVSDLLFVRVLSNNCSTYPVILNGVVLKPGDRSVVRLQDPFNTHTYFKWSSRGHRISCNARNLNYYYYYSCWDNYPCHSCCS